jgi:hypothetical protein
MRVRNLAATVVSVAVLAGCNLPSSTGAGDTASGGVASQSEIARAEEECPPLAIARAMKTVELMAADAIECEDKVCKVPLRVGLAPGGGCFVTDIPTPITLVKNANADDPAKKGHKRGPVDEVRWVLRPKSSNVDVTRFHFEATDGVKFLRPGAGEVSNDPNRDFHKGRGAGQEFTWHVKHLRPARIRWCPYVYHVDAQGKRTDCAAKDPLIVNR